MEVKNNINKRRMKMYKIKLFTHTDLDGVGCAILGRYMFKESIDIEYCDYGNVNDKINTFLDSGDYKNYIQIFITDLSVNEEVANKLHSIHEKVKLLDHHKTALWLNKYDWVLVEEIDDELNLKTSGTYMFYKYTCKEVTDFYELKLVSDIIRRYDTWEWKETNDILPKKFNDLYYIYGRDVFLNKVIKYFEGKNDFLIDEQDDLLLKLKQTEIDNYLDSKNKSIIKTNLFGYKVGIIFAERFHSEIGNRLCEINNDVDLVVIINIDYSISYRTIKDIDLSIIAKQLGGGGHPKASGSPLPDDLKMEIIRNCFLR